VLVVSASTGVKKLTCRSRKAVETIPLYSSWGRGVYGWKYINKPDKGVKERRWKQ